MLQNHLDAVLVDFVGGLEASCSTTPSCIGFFGASLFPVAGRHGGRCAEESSGRVEHVACLLERISKMTWVKARPRTPVASNADALPPLA